MKTMLLERNLKCVRSEESSKDDIPARPLLASEWGVEKFLATLGPVDEKKANNLSAMILRAPFN